MVRANFHAPAATDTLAGEIIFINSSRWPQAVNAQNRGRKKTIPTKGNRSRSQNHKTGKAFNQSSAIGVHRKIP